MSTHDQVLGGQPEAAVAASGETSGKGARPLKVIVFGSRSWDEPTTVKHRLRLLPSGSTIIHGDSPGGGADAFADIYGSALGFEVVRVPINDYDRLRARQMSRPKFAPIARNVRLVQEHHDADLAIGFWDGNSPGSAHMKSECEKAGIATEIIQPRIPARPSTSQRGAVASND